MDFAFDMHFLSALFTIVIIDLVLAGDNAIVIALAARNLPKTLQTKAIIWGTAGAIIVRSLMTVTVVWLLQIPGLMLVGGAALIWVAYKLLTEEDGDDENESATTSFWGAIKTIVIADALMGMDNVLGVAGAAHGSFLLVVLGLLISIPIVVWGSTIVLKFIERFPAIIYVGSAILAYTAAKMILGEPLTKPYFDAMPALVAGIYILSFGLVLGGGHYMKTRAQTA